MKNFRINALPLISSVLFLIFFLGSCSVTGPSGIFGKKSPHEQYGQKLADAGLKQTVLGKLWLQQAEESLEKPLLVTIPYKEAGYFPAEKPRAVSLKFETKRGERISVSLLKKPSTNFTVYVDLWEVKNNQNKKLVAYADTNAAPFSYDIEDEGTYLLRLQPELLVSGEYTLTIASGPSLAFPVEKGNIGSFWGDDRDGGNRRHEGIDIFAKKRTPALAAADGVVSRVEENRLGGKVVFLRPENKNFNLYYAHLDEQLVKDGQRVKLGDTIGLVGNTGNAIHTAPHLHFGIYTFGGAIDPVNFVRPVDKKPSPVTVPVSNIGKSLRTNAAKTAFRESPGTSKGQLFDQLSKNTLVQVLAASAGWYKVGLPDGREGFISGTSLTPLSEPLRRMKIEKEVALLDNPKAEAPRKILLSTGATVNVLGKFNDFYFISSENNHGWISVD
ncbi:M23 family metallopeptidase [Desertivirga arenae]|uniref:M23 family metallopeptidase n=1 Tax=Desertivirga arenae TaxID=2810309 RepID=UPI001A97B1DB|nr:M23 family metallopeptidase [Pedobacter sp. SYSU D00823]